MGTRAAAFTAKIHNLQHYNSRIQNGILPLPSGDDVANTLKYFSQTLLSVLKDVPTISLEMLRSPEQDPARTALFPSLDYIGLYHAIVDLVDAVPLVQHGAHALGRTILHTLACLVPFLEHEYMDTLPYLVASSMTLFPCSLHKDIVDMLCHHLLPFTFIDNTKVENESYASMSTAAVLMMIFQYTDCSAFHCQVLECFMSLRKAIVKDLLCVVAHGTAKARCHAVELLFQYLPTLNPALLDRKGIGNKLNGWLLDSLCTLTCLVLFPTFSPSSVSPSLMPPGSTHTGWKPLLCQRENCQSSGSNEAIKMCFDHSIVIGSGEQPPPLYICEACADDIMQEHNTQHMIDVLLPMDKVSVTCENADCKASDKSAAATCFSIECTLQNGHRPIRYCAECLLLFHNNEQGTNHIVHTTIPSPWEMDPETQSYMVEAIMSLLHEAEPMSEKHSLDTAERPYQSALHEGEDSRELTTVEERQLLSRYGIWLLVGLCMPTKDTPVDSLGRLLSMLFQWFHYTACLPDDQAGNALERLKAEYIHGWLMEVLKSHFDVFVSCLLPHPAEYAQVGGHWETWPSQTSQIKEGFKRLLCLVPYDIITLEVWEFIMPYWMEAFRHEVVESELNELKILLSKILDPDLSPLGFDTKQMYKFLTIRFEGTTTQVQEQALYWLQILTMLEVPIPLDLLFDMVMAGVESITNGDGKTDTPSACKLIPHPSEMQGFPSSSIPPAHSTWPAGRAAETVDDGKQAAAADDKPDSEVNLSCYILILDILIKQLELQEIPSHKGLEQKDAQKVMLLLRDIIKAPWSGVHTCSDGGENVQCVYCEISAIWFQLCLVLIEYFSPVMEVTMADISIAVPASQMPFDYTHYTQEPVEKTKEDRKLDPELSAVLPTKEESVTLLAFNKLPSEDNELIEMTGHISPVQTAMVQDIGSDLDSASVMPLESIVTAVATEVTLTEDDVAGAKCTVATAVLIDENRETVSQVVEDSTFWQTSEGKFKFTIDELPPQLQLFYALLKELADFKDADVLYHILSCLKVMCLHAEVLNKAAHNYRGFLIWCQENLMISNLWKLLQSEFSHIAQYATSLLLHAVTLPSGLDMFWKSLEQDFHSDDWRSRYAAVEKVTMIAHFVEPATVKNSPLLQSALANAFCYLIRCLDDIQATISQRTLLNLETVKTSSIKLLLWCLEVQFDSALVDRPMILQTIYQLYNHLSSRRFLSWDFFFNRFDTLFLEAQILLDRNGEVSYIRDLKNSNTNSEMFQKKKKRAQDALSLSGATRSLTASFGIKWPYQRAMSAPGGMISRQEMFDKDKVYERQSSAPVLKRKSSKLIGSTVGSLGPLQHFPNSFFTDGHLKETMQEESHFLNILHRAMDLEDHDKDTLHLLIFLLSQFLSRPDPSHRSEDKVTRSQHLVLRHLNLLLGYSQSQNEGRFLIPPYKVRGSPVFNAFLMSMPKVLDYNFAMGNVLLSTCLSLLVCCPSPQKYPSEHYPPSYSLWLLEPYCRHSWLLSVMVIMYKYHYDGYPYSRYIHWLVVIVLNTLKAQRHKCKHVHEPLLSPLPSRSRDLSTPSADTENVAEKEKDLTFEVTSLHDDIIKPFVGSGMKLKGFGSKHVSSDKPDDLILEQVQKTGKDKSERQQWKAWKASDRSGSSEGEDAEPELEAIPESPKSESPDHEQFPSELTGISQVLEQACIRLASDSGSAAVDQNGGSVSWPKMANKEDLVENHGTSCINDKEENLVLLAEIPCGSTSHDSDTGQVIEKAALETMEKHISKQLIRQDSNVLTGYEVLETQSGDYSDDREDANIVTSERSEPTNGALKTEPIVSQIHSPDKTDFLFVESSSKESEINVSLPQRPLSSSKTEDGLSKNHSVLNKAVKTDLARPGTPDLGVQVHNWKQSLAAEEKQRKTPQCEVKSTAKAISQSVDKNKDNSSLVLPDSDCETAVSHSKYPKPKFLSKKDHSKALKVHSPRSDTLTVPICRPPLERLLPVGPSEREKMKKLEVPSSGYALALAQMPHQTIPGQLHRESSYPLSKDLFEDKGVQTGAKDLPFDIPPQERLLPIGPLPSKKDWFTAPVFKTTLGEGPEDKLSLNLEEFAAQSADLDVPGNHQAPKVEEEIENSSSVHCIEGRLASSDVMFPNDEEGKSEVSKDLEGTIPNSGGDDSESPETSRVKPPPLQKSATVDFVERRESGILSECIPPFSPDALGRISTFGIFDVCKSAMEIAAEPTGLIHSSKLDRDKGEMSDLHHPNISSLLDLAVEKSDLWGSRHNEELSHKLTEKAPDDEVKCKLPFRQRKQRKPGLSAIDQRSFDHQNTGFRRIRKAEAGSIPCISLASKRSSTSQSSNARFIDDVVVDRCTDCGVVLEEYGDEELGLCIVILATFVHREPSMAAPLLPKMLRVVSRIASSTSYPWQSESNVHLPGGSVSVARQFLRCTLHQLAPNGIFVQIFQSHSMDADFFKTMAAALADFTEVNQVTPLLHLFENLNERKHLHHELVLHVLDNVAMYLDFLPLESGIPPWGSFLQQLELFLRKFLLALSPGPCHLNNVLHIMLAALKMPLINTVKSILDPFSKVLSHSIQHSALDYQQLLDLCHFCYRNMSRERDKQLLTRTAVFELVQALKFKSSIPDANVLILVQFVLEDSGGNLGPSVIVDGLPTNTEVQSMYNTSSAECMRQYLNDALEFVADVHTLNKVKNMLYGTSTHLNEETLGGQLKAGIAQYLAIEISKGNGRDNRAIGRYLPWLYHPPTTLQQGPKEFIDCVSHIRLLSWLLLGALIHSALLQNTETFVCQPIPLEANSHIAEHIQVILAGFAEQSKVSVLHMSSLFHAFILCQLWTMYCEHMVSLNPPGSEQNQVCVLTLTDFWAKITPGILQLVCHSKVEEQFQLAEMVSLHFLSLMEALLECNSTILARLLPMWTPVLYSFQGQMPGNLHVRLHACLSWHPPVHAREEFASGNSKFLRWLQRLQFKMGQIELQSSTATQFYSL